MPPFDALKTAFSKQQFFAGKTWHLSPAAFPLSPAQVEEIKKIGNACLAFYKAQELLYSRSAQGKKILRNGEVFAPRIAEYLDRGKPAGVVAHGRHKAVKNQTPVVIRPDLLITEDGFALTELDSVPGGIGLTAYLNSLYAGDDTGNVIGALRQPELFYRSVAALAPATENPLIAIVVSDESATYRPEFDWLAERLRDRGRRVYCVHPSELLPRNDAVRVSIGGAPERIDVLYRFFELFDLENVENAGAIFAAVESGDLIVTPPMKAFQEEKLNLALLHHPALTEFWRENIAGDKLALLRKIVPRTWIMESVALPLTAVLHAPWMNGTPICTWTELAGASQKERNLIIKASGFHEDAWGSRSVTLGSDVSRDEWRAALENATAPENKTFYVMQDYRKPARVRHALYRDDGTSCETEGRVRLCPYFFAGDSATELGAILATVCPADKKIIHGMSDASLMPCAVAAESGK